MTNVVLFNCFYSRENKTALHFMWTVSQMMHVYSQAMFSLKNKKTMLLITTLNEILRVTNVTFLTL